MSALSHRAGARTRLEALLGALAMLLLSQAVCGPAHAQPKFPTKPVRLFLPFGAGGVADVTAMLTCGLQQGLVPRRMPLHEVFVDPS
jgi:hypothetical protein